MEDSGEHVANEFKKAFKGIDAAIKQGTARALNRALSSSRAKIGKVLRDETGLPNKVIYARMREVKANVNNLRVKLAIATKVGVALSAFKPSAKKTKVVHAGNKKATTHYGVTVKVGKQSRQLVPGGFLATAKGSGKELVLARKGKARLPTVALRTQVFADTVVSNKADIEQYMQASFDKEVVGFVDASIKKKFVDNK